MREDGLEREKRSGETNDRESGMIRYGINILEYLFYIKEWKGNLFEKMPGDSLWSL